MGSTGWAPGAAWTSCPCGSTRAWSTWTRTTHWIEPPPRVPPLRRPARDPGGRTGRAPRGPLLRSGGPPGRLEGGTHVAVIEIANLHKEYFRRIRGGRSVALAGLTLEVPEGGVYGFLGPNGSGKTTTIRCLLGLVRPSAGASRMLGANTQREGDLAGVIDRVGSIVETPTLFPQFSGRRNLELLAAMRGIQRRAVDRVLERVGLADRSRDRVKTYSLGMKQ